MLYRESFILVFFFLQRSLYQKLSVVSGFRERLNTKFIVMLGTQTQCSIVLLILSNAMGIHFKLET